MKMTDELYVSMSFHDENTTTTIGRLPDDDDYELDIFIPRESHFVLPERFPKMKQIRFMFSGCDSEFYDQYKKYGEVIFFSNFWLFEYVRTMDISEVKDVDVDHKVFGISMNNYPKRHRIIMLKHLDKEEILDQCYYSLVTPATTEPNKNWTTQNVIWSGQLQRKTLPSQQKISADFSTEFELTIPVEYQYSFLDIVNETHDFAPFITEKTWRPIIFGKPFIVNASKDFYKSLQKMGFLLYDELFDYSFDDIEDTEERIKEVVKQIDSIIDRDYDEMWESIYPKLRYNQQLAFLMIKNEIGVPKIEDKFELWTWVVSGAKEKIQDIEDKISI